MTLLSILLSITLLVLAVFSLTKYELKVKRKIKKLNKKIKKGKDVFEYERAICQAYPYIVSVFFRIKKGRRYLKELSEILSVKLPKKEEFSLPAYNNLIRTERILTKIKSEFKPNLKQVKKMTASVDKPKKRDFNLLELSNLKYLFYANGKVKLINCQESFVCDVDVFDGINELKVKDSFFFSSGTTYSLENDRVKCVIRYYPHVEGVRANVFYSLVEKK